MSVWSNLETKSFASGDKTSRTTFQTGETGMKLTGCHLLARARKEYSHPPHAGALTNKAKTGANTRRKKNEKEKEKKKTS